MTTSYELARAFPELYHSELMKKISNVAREFNNSVIRFEKQGEAYYNLNTAAFVFITMLLGGEKNNDYLYGNKQNQR